MALVTNNWMVGVFGNCFVLNYSWCFILAAVVDVLSSFQPVFAERTLIIVIEDSGFPVGTR